MSMHGYHSDVTGGARALDVLSGGCADAATGGIAYAIAVFGAEG